MTGYSTRLSGRLPRVVLAMTLLLAVFAMVAVRPAPASAQTAIDCSTVPTQAVSPAGAMAAATPATAATPVAFPADGGSMTVFAAASLTNAFDQIGKDISVQNPNVTITFNYAGSQALVTQLSQGAQADVFASANDTQMAKARDAGVISGDPRTFVRNRLVIVVPQDNPAGINSPADLAKDGAKIVLAQADVPVGQYARQSLCLMGQDPATYGDDFVNKVSGNVVSEEEDVRAVLTRVQLGEADAGIVYVSDYASTQGGGVTTVDIPANVNEIATYPIAAVQGGNDALASAFISYVLGSDGQATLKQNGFDPVNG